jgi:hypothetical protein
MEAELFGHVKKGVGFGHVKKGDHIYIYIYIYIYIRGTHVRSNEGIRHKVSDSLRCWSGYKTIPQNYIIIHKITLE